MGGNGPALTFGNPMVERARRLKEEILRTRDDGTFAGPMAWEYLNGPEHQGAHITIANPYSPKLAFVTIPTSCTKEELEDIKAKVTWNKVACAIVYYIAASIQTEHMAVLEGGTCAGKSFLTEIMTEALMGPGVKPIELKCTSATEVEQISGGARARTARDEREKGASNALLEEMLGAIPKAFIATLNPDGTYSFDEEKPGPGTILHMEEATTLDGESSLALLHVGGRGHKLVREFFSDKLERSFPRGKRAGVVLSQNEPGEEYGNREGLDKAVVRRTDLMVVPDMDEEDMLMTARDIYGYRLKGAISPVRPINCYLELCEHQDLCAEIADIMTQFHRAYTVALKKVERNRPEKISATLDDMNNVATRLREHQVLDLDSEQVDIVETLSQAVEHSYIGRHKDEKFIAYLKGTLEALLEDDTVGRKKFRGKLMTRKEILETVVTEASIDPAELARKNRAELTATLGEVRNSSAIPDGIKNLLDIPGL